MFFLCYLSFISLNKPIKVYIAIICDMMTCYYRYGVRSVTLSWRTKPMPFNWPADKFSTVPLLTRVEGSKCFFKDGSSKKVDAIILCTGYKHHFPFMEERYL